MIMALFAQQHLSRGNFFFFKFQVKVIGKGVGCFQNYKREAFGVPVDRKHPRIYHKLKT
jgi:hypothetical protein